jgi:hypothetical protein
LFLTQTLKELTVKERYEKAGEYFRAAMRSMNLRYHFKCNFNLHFSHLCLYVARTVGKIYHFQTSPAWNSFLSFMSWIYLFLTFFEPTQSSQNLSNDGITFYFLFLCELIILLLFVIDDVLEVIHRSKDQERGKSQHFLKNFKFVSKSTVDICLLTDFILFFAFYSKFECYFRFGRILRPIKLCIYSKEMRRQMKAIFKTIPHIVDVILLFFLVAVIYAILGAKLLSEDLTEEEKDQVGVILMIKPILIIVV